MSILPIKFVMPVVLYLALYGPASSAVSNFTSSSLGFYQDWYFANYGAFDAVLRNEYPRLHDVMYAYAFECDCYLEPFFSVINEAADDAWTWFWNALY